jgi:3-hydroxybutyryl-CoA dehydratase
LHGLAVIENLPFPLRPEGSSTALALDRTIVTQPTLFFEDLGIGQRASLMRRVAGDDLQRLAGMAAEADSPPIPTLAARTAFGQHIAHGMFTANLISAVLGTKLPGPGAVYLAQTIQFLAPVRIGDVVTAHVEVVELVPSRNRARLFCECICEGKAVLEGEAWVAVESRAGA